MSFIFGGNTGSDYEQMQRHREIAKRLMGKKGTPQTAIQGANMMLEDIVGGIHDRRAQSKMEEGQATFGELFGTQFGSDGGYVGGLSDADVISLAGNPFADPAQDRFMDSILANLLGSIK